MSIVEWHTKLKLPASEEEIAKRSKAIRSIINNEHKWFWYDLIKLYFGKNTDEKTTNYLVDELVRMGCDVPRSKNEKLLQHIAGMILVTRFQSAIDELNSIEDGGVYDEEEEEEQEDDLSSEENEAAEEEESSDGGNLTKTICFALLNYNFFELEKSNSKIPVFAKADEYQSLIRKNEKTLVFPSLDELNLIEERLEDKKVSFSNQEALDILTNIKHLSISTSIIAEELNTLWWLQGEFSTIRGQYFNEIGYQKMTAIAPLELAMLSNSDHAIQSAQSILNKVLYLSNDRKYIIDQISIKKCFNDFDEETKKTLLNGIDSLVDIFTPCLLALKNSIANKNWSSNLGEKVDATLHPIAISFQLYKEYIYLKSLNS